MEKVYGYKEHKDGSFRLRASFPMDRELMLKANAVCNLEQISMYELCRDAVRAYCHAKLSASSERPSVSRQVVCSAHDVELPLSA